jgi:hypothetical protein
VTVHLEPWRWINNQPDAEKVMYLLVSQHVSGIIMPIIRRMVQSRQRLWCTGMISRVVKSFPTSAHQTTSSPWVCCSTVSAVHHRRCRICTVLLMMGMIMPETCWDTNKYIIFSASGWLFIRLQGRRRSVGPIAWEMKLYMCLMKLWITIRNLLSSTNRNRTIPSYTLLP